MTTCAGVSEREEDDLRDAVNESIRIISGINTECKQEEIARRFLCQNFRSLLMTVNRSEEARNVLTALIGTSR